jgi:uncharacterized protein
VGAGGDKAGAGGFFVSARATVRRARAGAAWVPAGAAPHRRAAIVAAPARRIKRAGPIYQFGEIEWRAGRVRGFASSGDWPVLPYLQKAHAILHQRSGDIRRLCPDSAWNPPDTVSSASTDSLINGDTKNLWRLFFVDAIIRMKITFDQSKRDATLAERGLAFEDAVAVFERVTLDMVDCRFHYDEARIITAGYLDGRMVIVVWTARGNARHIISMRKANEREKARFAQRLDEA